MTTKSARSGLLTAAHLVLYGLFGFAVLSVLLSIGAVGVSMLPIVIGVFPLVFFAWGLGGIARWEELRVSGLFGIPYRPQEPRTSTRTDGWRWLHTLWLHLTTGRDWLGLLHFTIISALGTAALAVVGLVAGSLQGIISALVHPGTHSVGAILGDLVGLGLAVLALWGLTVAHRGISRGMLTPSRTSELREQAVVATRRRDDAMSAAQIERSRIERDLHDGVQPRLVSVGMTLGMAKNALATDPAAAASLIDEAHISTKEAITELRHLARGFHPAVLEDRGLDAALSALAAQSRVPVELDVQLTGRGGTAAEAALYFAIAESLTNVAKHAGATSARVTVRERPGAMLWARIEDDGHGGAQRLPGGGLDGIANRVAAAGGTLNISSPVSGPTSIEVSVPCAS